MIEELTLQKFKSYGSRQTIRFTAGVNKISGRNASGKTTILEAILFGLFGEVPGVNKQDLVPLDGGKLHVSLAFRSPQSGRRAKIIREGVLIRLKGKEETFKTTDLLLDVEGEDHPYVREKDVQAKIKELLGVGKRVFFNVVYAKQKEFIEILNPDKGRMDAILGLTTATEAREELREVRRQLEIRGKIGEKPAVEERMRIAGEAIAEAEQLRERAEEQREYLTQQAEDLREKLGEARVKVDAMESLAADLRRLKERQSDLDVIKGRREEREGDLTKLLEAIGENPEEKMKELQAKLRSAEAAEERLTKVIEEDLGQERRMLDGEIARLDHQVGEHLELKKQGVAICPKCGQQVNYSLLEEDLSKWEAQLKDKRMRLADLELELKQTRDQAKLTQEKRIEARNSFAIFEDQFRRMEDLKRAIDQLDGDGEQLVRQIAKENEDLMLRAWKQLGVRFASIFEGEKMVDERLRLLRDDLASVQGDFREAEALLREAHRRIADIEQRLKTQRETLESSRALLDQILEYEAKIRAIDEIQERYGEYERQLRDNTLKDLEYRTYRYFQRLTDQQMYSFCRIDRENYVLEVGPIGSNRPIPAWRAGGGHESLFALSERLALLRVMGFPHLLILDEPTDAVDSENIPQMLEYIARSSQEIGQVLLVTHHGHGEEEGVNLIRVRKVNGESRVTQESLRLRVED